MRTLGLLIALAGCGRVHDKFEESRKDIAKITVDKLATEAYPQWAIRSADKLCPDSLSELAKYMPESAGTKDPWGVPYKMYCGPTLPAAVKSGAAVISFGPDKIEGTADDITSW